MAVNKESSIYTFGFSIVLVVVVGALLSSLSLGLKPLKDKNARVKKKMDILNAIGIKSDRSTADGLYDDFIKESYIIGANGDLVSDVDSIAFQLDVQRQHRDKTIAEDERLFPIFKAQKDGNTKYVLPVVGKGLWGPIWGFIAVGEDMETIVGASFDHKTETPGLGAEINQSDFEDQYIGARITADIMVMKDGSGKSDTQKVDGITGGTITSKGVEEMMNRTMAVYAAYFSKQKNS
jgi:Na+-transporting NADH:ubiquinone oxidoreductase subunit C